jgi:hypothetical protein
MNKDAAKRIFELHLQSQRELVKSLAIFEANADSESYDAYKRIIAEALAHLGFYALKPLVDEYPELDPEYQDGAE